MILATSMADKTPGTRRKGLILLSWSGALFALVLAGAWWAEQHGWHYFPWMLAIPGGIALAGLVQVVTGVPFGRLSDYWDALRPWQRGVFGTGIVLVVFALLYGGAIAIILLTQR